MTEEQKSPAVYGCGTCLRVFSTDTYHLDATYSGYNYCIGCGSAGLEFLGILPLVMEEEDKFFLIGEEDGLVTGPYDSQELAQRDIWHWFTRKDAHGEVIAKSRRKGHLRLAALEGIILKEEDVKEEGVT